MGHLTIISKLQYKFCFKLRDVNTENFTSSRLTLGTQTSPYLLYRRRHLRRVLHDPHVCTIDNV